jgi:hypothetical protein
MEMLFAGAVAGLLSDAITHPINTAKTRMQVFRASEGAGTGGAWSTLTHVSYVELISY